MASSLDAFALEPQSQNRGLARRLMDQTLRPPEREYFARVEAIAALEDQGLKGAAIAETLGLPYLKLIGLMRTDKYRLCRKYLADRGRLAGDQHAHERRQSERRRWDANGGRALDYYDQAFRRHTKGDPKKGIAKGDFCDPDRAERAAQLFARSAGWTEPVPTHAKPKELTLGVIQQAMQAIRAADSRQTVVRVTETTTIEVGSRSETAGLGVAP
jgi:hypothetical protein